MKTRRPPPDAPRWGDGVSTEEEREAYASRHGYFWLPCVLCGTMSGGHEWEIERGGNPASIPNEQPGSFTGICPQCTADGRGTDIHARLLHGAGTYQTFDEAREAVLKGARWDGLEHARRRQ